MELIRVVRSQWIKLRRPTLLWGTLGAVLAVSVLTSALVVYSATSGTAAPPGPGANRSTSLAQLSSADGLADGLANATTLLGIVALCVFAAALAGEYTQGTLRNLLIRQPRRLRLLGGVWLALAGFAVLMVAVATVSSAVAAVIAASLGGVDITAWGSTAALGHLAGTAGDTALATIGWGSLGLALAVLFRAPVPAIAVGVGYALPVETILIAAVTSAKPYLPGQLLAALASGGNADIGYGRALFTVGLYAAVAATGTAMLFRRRDVTS